MTLGWVLLLFLVAAIVFGVDFLLGLANVSCGRLRVHSFAFCLMAVALMLWHGGL